MFVRKVVRKSLVMNPMYMDADVVKHATSMLWVSKGGERDDVPITADGEYVVAVMGVSIDSAPPSASGESVVAHLSVDCVTASFAEGELVDVIVTTVNPNGAWVSTGFATGLLSPHHMHSNNQPMVFVDRDVPMFQSADGKHQIVQNCIVRAKILGFYPEAPRNRIFFVASLGQRGTGIFPESSPA